MYDDRGIDIVTYDKETLRPIYMSFTDGFLSMTENRFADNLNKTPCNKS